MEAEKDCNQLISGVSEKNLSLLSYLEIKPESVDCETIDDYNINCDSDVDLSETFIFTNYSET